MNSYFKTFINSFRLRNAYKVNTVINSIERIPGVKKLTGSDLYKDGALKIIGTIISLIMELGNIFLTKALYIIIIIFSTSFMFPKIQIENILNIYVFLTLVGLIFNTDIFNPTKDKFYAISLLKMDSKKYALSNYFYFLSKILIGQTITLLIISLFTNLETTLAFLLPLFTVFMKVIYLVYLLNKYKYKKMVFNENKPTVTSYIIAFILLALAYGLPLINIFITPKIFYAVFIISFIIFVFALKYIIEFNEYDRVFKKLLTGDNIVFNLNSYTTSINKETYLKQIELGTYTSNKTGYAYFNEIFVKRHYKLLMRSGRNTALVSLAIFILIIAATLFDKKMGLALNKQLLNFLPYFLFIMYVINKGQAVTQAMFMNCDHSMLTYRFYRDGKSIVLLFMQRLKTLIKINMLPALVIAVCLPILLYTSGGTTNYLNYCFLFLTIIAMAVFFTVHHMVLYYLLQPYNIESETKSSMYSIINGATYMIVYLFINVRMPIILFGSITSAFAVLYVLVALFLAYKYAPKTFKLR